ncbi:MAG: hypothetical protein KTR14_04590 [Vampirovibrio sp.]|nr:hypothetical protein [Vampirovibrio sp.]
MTFTVLNRNKSHQARHILMAGSLTVALALSGLTPMAFAKTPRLATKDFLPPIASINGKVEAIIPEVGEASDPESLLEPVSLAAVSSPVLKTTPKVETLKNDLSARMNSDEFQTILSLQHAQDAEDLKNLWDATVERNPVIRFSLEKLATPPDLHTSKSSMFLKKTLNMMIMSAAMGSSLLPGAGGAYRQMGVMAGGDAVQNLVSGKTRPQGDFLTTTEQIQLAGLIDELQGKLYQSYHDYKNSLQLITAAHQKTVESNKLYSKALASKNETACVAAGSAYYKALLNETRLRQEAMKQRIQLERLAGIEPVQQLALAVDVPDQTADSSTPDTAGLLLDKAITDETDE